MANEEEARKKQDEGYSAALKEIEGEQQEEQAPSLGAAPGSLGRVATEAEKREEAAKEFRASPDAPKGWRKIDVSTLPSKGQFIASDVRIRIRAATVEEIKHWSGLDDTDMMDVIEHINV